MTLLPVEPVRIGQGLNLEVEPHGKCMHPTCNRSALEAHHIIRRSHLGKPWTAVEIDGVLQPNVAVLCGEHHRRLTVGEERIRWDTGWEWVGRTLPGAWEEDGAPLDPHPRIIVGARRPARAVEKPGDPTLLEPARKRSKWVVRVPDDAENGADILDELCAQAAERLGREYEPAIRYHVLAAALYGFLT